MDSWTHNLYGYLIFWFLVFSFHYHCNKHSKLRRFVRSIATCTCTFEGWLPPSNLRLPRLSYNVHAYNARQPRVTFLSVNCENSYGKFLTCGSFRECRSEESKVQFVLQGAGLPRRDYELAWLFTESASTVLQKKSESESKEGSSDNFFATLLV